MLVDRIFKFIFDSLKSVRENRYRHPHCIIVTYWKTGARGEEPTENCMKNAHVQILNL
jgi:hypothetical protein